MIAMGNILLLFSLITAFAYGSSVSNSDGIDIPQGNGINIQETPFKNIIDFATWTQYLCEKLYQAGDYKRLNLVAHRLSRLGQDLQGPLQAVALAAYRKYTDLYETWFRRHVNFKLSKDQVADSIFRMIEEGKYFKAKKKIATLLNQDDYIGMSLSMKYIIILGGLIQYDGINPKAVLPIWDIEWNLSQDEKISALIRTKQLCQAVRDGSTHPRTLQPFRPFRRINQVDARVLANLGINVSGMYNEDNIRGDHEEIGMLNASMALMQTDFCRARDLVDRFRGGLILRSTKRKVADALYARSAEMCSRKQLDSTYHAFCQVGHESAYPISEALAVDNKPQPVARNETMFWLRVAAGDCDGARDEYSTIRRMVPWDILARREYLSARFEFMERQIASCQPVVGLFTANNGIGQQIMTFLWDNKLTEADEAWRHEFANRPHDHYAILWRKVIMSAQYPKIVYAPCVGNSLLSGNLDIDNELFERLEVLKHKGHRQNCQQNDHHERDSCNLLWMKAAYIANNFPLVHEYAQLIHFDPQSCNESYQLLACVTLCGSGQGSTEACAAKVAYNRLGLLYRSQPHNSIGIELSDDLCKTGKQLVLDSFYIRYGSTPRPLTYLLREYYSGFFLTDAKKTLATKTCQLISVSTNVTKAGVVGGGKVSDNGLVTDSSASIVKDSSGLTSMKATSGSTTNFSASSSRVRAVGSVQQSTEDRMSISSIKVAKKNQKEAFVEAQAYICPCLRHISNSCQSRSEQQIDRLIEVFRKALQKEHIGKCNCKKTKKFNKTELEQSGALRVVANLYAGEKAHCPCLKRGLVEQHRTIPYKGGKRGKATASVFVSERKNAPSVVSVRQKNNIVQRDSAKVRYVRADSGSMAAVVQKSVSAPVQTRKSTKVGGKVIKRAKVQGEKNEMPQCVRALVKKYPFLKIFISGYQSKKSCQILMKRLKAKISGMLREIDSECADDVTKKTVISGKPHLKRDSRRIIVRNSGNDRVVMQSRHSARIVGATKPGSSESVRVYRINDHGRIHRRHHRLRSHSLSSIMRRY